MLPCRADKYPVLLLSHRREQRWGCRRGEFGTGSRIPVWTGDGTGTAAACGRGGCSDPRALSMFVYGVHVGELFAAKCGILATIFFSFGWTFGMGSMMMMMMMIWDALTRDSQGNFPHKCEREVMIMGSSRSVLC